MDVDFDSLVLDQNTDAVILATPTDIHVRRRSDFFAEPRSRSTGVARFPTRPIEPLQVLEEVSWCLTAHGTRQDGHHPGR